MSETDIRLEIEKIKPSLDNPDKNIELIFQYLDELNDKVKFKNQHSLKCTTGKRHICFVDDMTLFLNNMTFATNEIMKCLFLRLMGIPGNLTSGCSL